MWTKWADSSAYSSQELPSLGPELKGNNCFWILSAIAGGAHGYGRGQERSRKGQEAGWKLCGSLTGQTLHHSILQGKSRDINETQRWGWLAFLKASLLYTSILSMRTTTLGDCPYPRVKIVPAISELQTNPVKGAQGCKPICSLGTGSHPTLLCSCFEYLESGKKGQN